MPTTNLSKRAEAIIKNSATLTIQKTIPARNHHWENWMERKDQAFYDRASADMLKLQEMAIPLHTKSATISRMCHRYDRMMSSGLECLGLPKMIWVALIETSKGDCDLNSYHSACFEDEARNWAYEYFGSDYDYVKIRGERPDTLEAQASMLMKQALTTLIHTKSDMHNYHYYVIIETFIEHFNKCRITNPNITIQQAYETFSMEQKAEYYLIEDRPFPFDYGEQTPFRNILEHDEYVNSHFDHSFFAQVVTVGSGTSLTAKRYVRQNFEELLHTVKSRRHYYHIPPETTIYLADIYQVSKNWCAKYFPNY